MSVEQHCLAPFYDLFIVFRNIVKCEFRAFFWIDQMYFYFPLILFSSLRNLHCLDIMYQIHYNQPSSWNGVFLTFLATYRIVPKAMSKFMQGNILDMNERVNEVLLNFSMRCFNVHLTSIKLHYGVS